MGCQNCGKLQHNQASNQSYRSLARRPGSRDLISNENQLHLNFNDSKDTRQTEENNAYLQQIRNENPDSSIDKEFKIFTNQGVTCKEIFLKQFFKEEKRSKTPQRKRESQAEARFERPKSYFEKRQNPKQAWNTNGIINNRMEDGNIIGSIGFRKLNKSKRSQQVTNSSFLESKRQSFQKTKGIQGNHEPEANSTLAMDLGSVTFPSAQKDIPNTKSMKINSKLSTNLYLSRTSTPRQRLGPFSIDKKHYSRLKRESAEMSVGRTQPKPIGQALPGQKVRSCLSYVDPRILETEQIFKRRLKEQSRSFKSNLLSFKTNSGVLVDQDGSARFEEFKRLEELLEKYFKTQETVKGKEGQVDKARVLIGLLKQDKEDRSHIKITDQVEIGLLEEGSGGEPLQEQKFMQLETKAQQQAKLLNSLEQSRSRHTLDSGEKKQISSSQKSRPSDEYASISMEQSVFPNLETGDLQAEKKHHNFSTPLKSQLSFDHEFNIFQTPYGRSFSKSKSKSNKINSSSKKNEQPSQEKTPNSGCKLESLCSSFLNKRPYFESEKCSDILNSIKRLKVERPAMKLEAAMMDSNKINSNKKGFEWKETRLVLNENVHGSQDIQDIELFNFNRDKGTEIEQEYFIEIERDPETELLMLEFNKNIEREKS